MLVCAIKLNFSNKKNYYLIIIIIPFELDFSFSILLRVIINSLDAGKSTISGNILYITGMVDQRLIEKYEKEAVEKNRSSWFLAYILDTNDEERAKVLIHLTNLKYHFLFS